MPSKSRNVSVLAADQNLANHAQAVLAAFAASDRGTQMTPAEVAAYWRDVAVARDAVIGVPLVIVPYEHRDLLPG